VTASLTLADNPAALDYLGFEELVDPIAEAIDCTTAPITVGIYGSWGSGKSSVLGMVSTKLAARGDVVVPLNPWEFGDVADVKGALIGAVLGELDRRFGQDAGIKERLGKLLRRISWSRATSALMKGALTMQWDLPQLVEAFTPVESEAPKSMAGFKEEFAGLISALPNVTRVVVAVDDLDRCLPEAVMGTLETIKLFLAVDRMAFVLAADHQMVTDAVAASLSETHRNTGFATLYLDKIVQIPVQVPRLTEHDAEAYAAILLAEAAGDSEEERKALAAHACRRRNLCQTPLLDDLQLPLQVPESNRRLAAQIARGLGADQRGTPRSVKRFLNGLQIRQRLAATRGIALDVEVVTKLFLLEQRFPPMFRTLAESDGGARTETLGVWEAWARSIDDAAPDGVVGEARQLLEDGPALSKVELDAYFSFAVTLDRVVAPAGTSASTMELVRGLLSAKASVSRSAGDAVAALSAQERNQVLEILAGEARRNTDPDAAIRALIRVGGMPDSDAALVTESLKGIPNRIKPFAAAELAKHDRAEYSDLISWLSTAADVPKATQDIAKSLSGKKF